MNFFKTSALGAALALGVLCSTPASAAQVYNWTFTNGSVVEGSGTLTLGAANNGGFDVTAFTGSLNDPTVGVNGPVIGFAPGGGNDGIFAWDNVVYTTPGQAHLDNLGLLFVVGGQEINIYNNNTGCCAQVYAGGDYPGGEIAAGSNNNYGGDRGTFDITAVPEPAMWAMMLMGMFSIGAAMRSKRRGATLA